MDQITQTEKNTNKAVPMQYDLHYILHLCNITAQKNTILRKNKDLNRRRNYLDAVGLFHCFYSGAAVQGLNDTKIHWTRIIIQVCRRRWGVP